MKESRNKFEKVFRCNQQEISDMLKSCMNHVEQSETEPVDADVRSRFKWVVTELLTNAIKHSGVEECLISIQNYQDKLVFEKTDAGNPLALNVNHLSKKVSWPLSGDTVPAHFEIYQNGIEALWVSALSSTEAAFSVRQMSEEDQPGISESMTEHFGLLILTKASDQFEYQYEPSSKTNRFRCIFNLKTN
jgi:two-component sensor histidine kinase